MNHSDVPMGVRHAMLADPSPCAARWPLYDDWRDRSRLGASSRLDVTRARPWWTLLASLTAWLALAPTAAAQPAELLQAYQREFSVLESEKTTLSRRLKEVQAEANRAVARGEGRIRGLQRQASTLREEADALEDELRKLSAQQEGEAEEDLVSQIFLRAAESYAQSGLTLDKAPEGQDSAARRRHLDAIFSRSPELLAVGQSIRKAPGAFFLTDGTQVDGELVHIGRIATYGVSDQGSGALAPAGQGRLKLWQEDATFSARALAEGQRPSVISVFLHESLEKAVVAPEEKTALGVVRAGGAIAWVIVALGVVALLLIILRAASLWIAGLGAEKLLKQTTDLISRGQLAAAAERAAARGGPMGRSLASAVGASSLPEQEQERAVAEALLHEVPRLERFGAAITVFAAVAPLLGLLGTVTGMIATFDIITEFGTGDPKLLSSGISEALITTELGLIVAIPTLLLGSLLSAWAESLISGLERGALQVLNSTVDAKGEA